MFSKNKMEHKLHEYTNSTNGVKNVAGNAKGYWCHWSIRVIRG